MGLVRYMGRGVVALALATQCLAQPTPAVAEPGTDRRASAGRIDLHRWSTDAAWRSGDRDGVAVQADSIQIRKPVGARVYRDPYGDGRRRHYDVSRWTSPWVTPGFGLSELVASWNATTPAGTWLEVQARGRLHSGGTGSWDVLGRWADGDRTFHRTTFGAQGDDYSSVNVDTLATNGTRRYTAWQLRVTLLRQAGTSRTPTVTSLGAVASQVPHQGGVATSKTSVHRRIELDVPRYSQMIHRGEYPQWDAGGEAWCSPTSTAMVVAYWGTGPTPKQYAWVDDSYAQPWVDHAARHTFDYRYDGAGNWSFNTAYAGRFGLDAFVTRLRSLRTAERYIRGGIPLVASIAFGAGALDGTPISSSAGHLLVIRGFTKRGDVIVNDPAAARAGGVRRVYDRGQFEDAWIPTTSGTAYVIRTPRTALPRSTR
ncbi:MAG: C39 family peptidase [Nocardioidaceae bacterium]|nr:C39 family peptidase [Nocardioidaceae bacterium]